VNRGAARVSGEQDKKRRKTDPGQKKKKKKRNTISGKAKKGDGGKNFWKGETVR